jgi:hypothetical protein
MLATIVVRFFLMAVLAFLLFICFITGLTLIRHPNDFSERLRKLRLSSLRLTPDTSTATKRFGVRVAGIALVSGALSMAYLILRTL